jgi:RNA polymerase sigma-B factor
MASLDAGSDDEQGGGTSIADSLGADDEALSALEDRETLRPLLAALPERERRIVMLRFFHNRTQSQIAEEMGISQMHVSRLLARTLASLRQDLAA